MNYSDYEWVEWVNNGKYWCDDSREVTISLEYQGKYFHAADFTKGTHLIYRGSKKGKKSEVRILGQKIK